MTEAEDRAEAAAMTLDLSGVLLCLACWCAEHGLPETYFAWWNTAAWLRPYTAAVAFVRERITAARDAAPDPAPYDALLRVLDGEYPACFVLVFPDRWWAGGLLGPSADAPAFVTYDRGRLTDDARAALTAAGWTGETVDFDLERPILEVWNAAPRLTGEQFAALREASATTG